MISFLKRVFYFIHLNYMPKKLMKLAITLNNGGIQMPFKKLKIIIVNIFVEIVII